MSTFLPHEMKVYMHAEQNYLRVGHVNVHTVFGVFLILTLCLQHEFLKDIVIPRNNTRDTRRQRTGYIKRTSDVPW